MKTASPELAHLYTFLAAVFLGCGGVAGCDTGARSSATSASSSSAAAVPSGAAAKTSAPVASAPSPASLGQGVWVGFEGYQLTPSIRLNLNSGLNVTYRGMERHHREAGLKVRAGESIRIGNFLVTPPSSDQQQVQSEKEKAQTGRRSNLFVLESPPALKEQAFGEPFTLTRDTARVFPGGTRVTFGQLRGGSVDPEGSVALSVERGEDWRWCAKVVREGGLRFQDVAIAFRAVNEGGAELVAFQGGTTRKVRFGEPISLTVLDTLETPDGSRFSIERYGNRFHGIVENGERRTEFEVSKWQHASLVELLALYTLNLGEFDNAPLERLTLTIDRVPDKSFRFGQEFTLAEGHAAQGPGGIRVAHLCTSDVNVILHQVVVTTPSSRHVLLGSVGEPPLHAQDSPLVKLVGRTEKGVRFVVTPAPPEPSKPKP